MGQGSIDFENMLYCGKRVVTSGNGHFAIQQKLGGPMQKGLVQFL
jgi:hypothetical protein